ncbi:MAG: DUF4411 family protein [Chloroflexi bacterium]|nr:DUF4411 family protein [Chloroflexota bacterium]
MANRHDFPIDTDPGTFWSFLEDMGTRGQIRVPETVFDEIERGDDSLNDWLSSRRDIFLVSTVDALPYLHSVLDAYGKMTDVELEELDGKADPYLVAHALVLGATVVTNETSRPRVIKPANKKIPDICSYLSVACITYPRFLWEMKP